MNPDRAIRPILLLSFAFNLTAAIMFAFPLSLPGRLVGMPWPAPIYRALVTAFIVMFALLYLWLALQRTIARPLVGFSAVVKVAAFGAIAVAWYWGSGSALGLVVASGDLVLAALFYWWLQNSR